MDLSTRDAIPVDAETFLAGAGWGGAAIVPLDGDASFRRYFRINGPAGSAMLMDAPPPHEDPLPYLRAAKWLDANGLRAPRILAEDAARAGRWRRATWPRADRAADPRAAAGRPSAWRCPRGR